MENMRIGEQRTSFCLFLHSKKDTSIFFLKPTKKNNVSCSFLQSKKEMRGYLKKKAYIKKMELKDLLLFYIRYIIIIFKYKYYIIFFFINANTFFILIRICRIFSCLSGVYKYILCILAFLLGVFFIPQFINGFFFP